MLNLDVQFGLVSAYASNLRVACCVALICSEIRVKRDTGESPNDHNDRRIRSAVLWYKSHFAENSIDGIDIILLTDDIDHLNKSIDQGIMAYTGTSLMFSLRLLYTMACVGSRVWDPCWLRG